MEDPIKEFKEKSINDYISQNIDLSHTGRNNIKMGLKNLLGEEPDVKFNYKQNMLINETSGKVERKENELESIEIWYSYTSNGSPLVARMKYIVN